MHLHVKGPTWEFQSKLPDVDNLGTCFQIFATPYSVDCNSVNAV
jgi:hypothetical protein